MVGKKVILAGVDGSGKSTIAKKLQEDYRSHGLNYNIVHSTKSTANDLPYFLSLLESEDNIIFDRFYADQFVYQTSEIRKDNGWLSLLDLVVVENKINELGCNCILVDADLDICLVNCLKDTEDSHYSLEYVEQLYNRYWYFIEYISSVDWKVLKNNFKV